MKKRWFSNVFHGFPEVNRGKSLLRVRAIWQVPVREKSGDLCQLGSALKSENPIGSIWVNYRCNMLYTVTGWLQLI